MKNTLHALAALGLLASGLQASPRPGLVTLGPTWLEEAGGPACRVGPSAQPLPSWSAPTQVHRDLRTGRFVAPPPGVPFELPRVLEVRPRALVETRIAAPGGGVRVDLSQRFATALVARRRADGELKMECAHPSSTLMVQSEPGSSEDRR